MELDVCGSTVQWKWRDFPQQCVSRHNVDHQRCWFSTGVKLKQASRCSVGLHSLLFSSFIIDSDAICGAFVDWSFGSLLCLKLTSDYARSSLSIGKEASTDISSSLSTTCFRTYSRRYSFYVRLTKNMICFYRYLACIVVPGIIKTWNSIRIAFYIGLTVFKSIYWFRRRVIFST